MGFFERLEWALCASPDGPYGVMGYLGRNPIPNAERGHLMSTKATVWLAIGVILGLLVIGAMLGGGSPSEEEKAAARATEEAEDAEYRLKGFHCLDEWDGHHRGLERLVKDQLHDPGSMEIYRTRIGRLNEIDQRHVVFMEFGATNAFGGMVRNTAHALVDHNTCEATLVNIY